jgi:hypothetical protein
MALVTRMLASSEDVWDPMASSSVHFSRKKRTVADAMNIPNDNADANPNPNLNPNPNHNPTPTPNPHPIHTADTGPSSTIQYKLHWITSPGLGGGIYPNVHRPSAETYHHPPLVFKVDEDPSEVRPQPHQQQQQHQHQHQHQNQHQHQHQHIP